uniref:RWD domain-containing protein 3 n=1 Tax=Callorhinchus milii TaxID=7868 RepID=A0A4W3H5T2_CALMI
NCVEKLLESNYNFTTLNFFQYTTDSEGIAFLIQTICDHLGKKFLLKITFQLSPEYPLCLPHISICSDHLTRKQCSDMKGGLMRYGETLLSQPMIYELMMWLQHNFQNYMDQSTVDKAAESNNSCGVWTSLLQLDHMRAKVKYIKSIEKWTSDLGLTGRLIFMDKLIFILLQGERDDIKNYLVLQKTCKVDVDSSGKKCKERMISVLREEKLQPEQQRYKMRSLCTLTCLWLDYLVNSV